MSKMILFVCATGVATSTAVAEKVMEYCKDNGLDVNYSQTKVPYELDIPVVSGLPIITGVGEDKVLEKIVSILKGQA